MTSMTMSTPRSREYIGNSLSQIAPWTSTVIHAVLTYERLSTSSALLIELCCGMCQKSPLMIARLPMDIFLGQLLRYTLKMFWCCRSNSPKIWSLCRCSTLWTPFLPSRGTVGVCRIIWNWFRIKTVCVIRQKLCTKGRREQERVKWQKPGHIIRKLNQMNYSWLKFYPNCADQTRRKSWCLTASKQEIEQARNVTAVNWHYDMRLSEDQAQSTEHILFCFWPPTISCNIRQQPEWILRSKDICRKHGSIPR